MLNKTPVWLDTTPAVPPSLFLRNIQGCFNARFHASFLSIFQRNNLCNNTLTISTKYFGDRRRRMCACICRFDRVFLQAVDRRSYLHAAAVHRCTAWVRLSIFSQCPTINSCRFYAGSHLLSIACCRMHAYIIVRLSIMLARLPYLCVCMCHWLSPIAAS